MKKIQEIEIRKAKLSEVGEIGNMQKMLNNHHRDFDKKYYAQNKNAKNIFMKWIRKRMRDRNSLLLVSLHKNKIVGYALGIVKDYPPVRKIKKHGYVSDVFVDKSYRGMGTSKRFIEDLRKWFKTKKLNYMEIHVDSRNRIGLAAWKKAGFKEIQKIALRKI